MVKKLANLSLVLLIFLLSLIVSKASFATSKAIIVIGSFPPYEGSTKLHEDKGFSVPALEAVRGFSKSGWNVELLISPSEPQEIRQHALNSTQLNSRMSR